MKIRRLFAISLALFIFALPALGQAVSYNKVKLYRQYSPNAKPAKVEANLNLDPLVKAAIFTVNNVDVQSVPYASITDITYQAKHHLLTFHYTDAAGNGQFAQCELSGANRDNLLAALETQSGVHIPRT
jgi:hypothetical protein